MLQLVFENFNRRSLSPNGFYYADIAIALDPLKGNAAAAAVAAKKKMFAHKMKEKL